MSVLVAQVEDGAGSPVLEELTGLGHRFAALLLLVLIAPVLVVVALLVFASSRGPVLYRQVRIGQFGRRFVIYKFRTMHRHAEHRLADVLADEGVLRVTPFFKIKDDPRITPVGKLLRTTSLDELPQLVNVLLGDMRLVGPRPQSPAEVATYDARTWRRLLVKPGITGLWQVHGRSDLSAQEGLELDLDYVRNWSPRLDAAVLVQTPRAVVGQRGAY